MLMSDFYQLATVGGTALWKGALELFREGSDGSNRTPRRQRKKLAPHTISGVKTFLKRFSLMRLYRTPRSPSAETTGAPTSQNASPRSLGMPTLRRKQFAPSMRRSSSR